MHKTNSFPDNEKTTRDGLIPQVTDTIVGYTDAEGRRERHNQIHWHYHQQTKDGERGSQQNIGEDTKVETVITEWNATPHVICTCLKCSLLFKPYRPLTSQWGPRRSTVSSSAAGAPALRGRNPHSAQSTPVTLNRAAPQLRMAQYPTSPAKCAPHHNGTINSDCFV